MVLKHLSKPFLLWYQIIQGTCYKLRLSDFEEHQVTVGEFKCPAQDTVASVPTKYADPQDCAKYYICQNGVTPEAKKCEFGKVYNNITKQCDGPENVPEW